MQPRLSQIPLWLRKQRPRQGSTEVPAHEVRGQRTGKPTHTPREEQAYKALDELPHGTRPPVAPSSVDRPARATSNSVSGTLGSMSDTFRAGRQEES